MHKKNLFLYSFIYRTKRIPIYATTQPKNDCYFTVLYLRNMNSRSENLLNTFINFFFWISVANNRNPVKNQHCRVPELDRCGAKSTAGLECQTYINIIYCAGTAAPVVVLLPLRIIRV